jgi:hypothetical protein
MRVMAAEKTIAFKEEVDPQIAFGELLVKII